MNITELDSYNLDDAVKFNDRLNPRLWDSAEHLHPEVREQLMRIAEDFREFLGVKDLDIEDITISGSNAAYTYTPNSDIDLHLVVRMPEDPVYRELFDAKKFQYNEQHDIKIGGADVELYVQAADQPHISQGIYSVLNNDWIAVPRRVKSVVDDTSTRNKFETVGHQIERAIKSGNLKRMTRMIEKIKKMRQTGLEAHGEFGPENLAFKLLRSQGLIQDLYDARNAAKDREFSLKEKAPAPKVTYGFRTPELVEDAKEPEVNTVPSDEDILRDFISFCVKELKIKQMPIIKLRKDPQWPIVHTTFGRYINDKNLLEVAWGNRHIMDVLRTVAHELTHRHQHERDGRKMGAMAGETGSPWENEANARAGIIMRDYARMHPEYFAVGQAHGLHADELKEYAPSADRDEQGPDEEEILRHYAAQWYNGDEDPGIEKLLATMGWEIGQNEDDAGGAFIIRQGDINGDSFISWTDAELTALNESASGYIPTRKQANDPRYKMALTVDIRPGQLGKEANKLKLKTDSQGHPQIARPNGLFEQLMMELQQFKEKKLFALDEQELDEVKMSPTSLMKWAGSDAAQGIRAGFEAELIFRDTASEDSDYDQDPDYDLDERCRSIDQVVEFFQNDDYGYGIGDRQAERLREGLDEQYYEWYDEQMYKDFSNEAEDLIRKLLVDEGDWDLDNEIQKQLALLDLTDDEMNEIIKAGESAPKFTSSKEQILYAEQHPLYDKYLDAQNEAEGLLDDLVADEVRKQGANWDAALDDFRDNYQIDDDSGFFDDVGLRWMSDVSNEYDLGWPYMTGGGNGGNRDPEEIADSLHGVVDMPVKLSSNYHSTLRREGQWIVEPDSSLQPDDREDYGLEIVSPPMPLLTTLEKLQQVVDWANGPGDAYTNNSTGLHMGVSVPHKGGDVDYVKLILFMGDEHVLQQFGRESSVYCKSALAKFRENIKGGRADPMGVIKYMQSGLLELAHKDIQKGVGTGKYTSAHIQDGYIEFRSPGGDWLSEARALSEDANSANILQNTMLRFARAMQIASDPSAERQEYAKKLYKLVAPEGDDPSLALFAKYSAGDIDKEQLKKQWAEKTIGTEKKMNQRFRLYQNVNGRWEPVPGAEWNGYPESEVKNRVWAKYGREALDSGEYQLVNMGEQDWEVYDVKTGKTLEIVKGKSKGEVADAVYDKYVDQGIGFQVRPWEDPATLTPRAKLAKRIATPKQKKPEQATNERGVPYWEVYEKETGHVVHTFLSDTAADAKQDGANWLDSVGAEQPNLFAVRAKISGSTTAKDDSQGVDNAQDAARLRNTLGVQDVESDVAQNFAGSEDPFAAYERNSDRINAIRQDATNRVGSWSIYDVTLGREIARMDDVAWSQADARANELERSTGHNMSVRGLSENITESAGQYVTRIDDHPIEDFSANMQTYYHTDDWSESGQFPKGATIPKRFTGQSQGVYAGDPTFTALYATGSSKETRYVAKYGPGQPIVWFDKKDLPRIRGKKTYLTVFNASNFKKVPSGEYFSSNPGKPVKQQPIADPFQYITDQGWVIRVTDNLPAVLKQLKAEKARYGSEGMGVQENFANNLSETLPAKNLNQLYKIKQQLANPAMTTAEPEPTAKPAVAKPVQPRLHAALTDLQRQREKIQQILDLKQEIETLTARAGRTRYGITPGLAADIEDIYPNPATEADMDAAIQGYEVQKKKLTDYIARQRRVFPKEGVAEGQVIPFRRSPTQVAWQKITPDVLGLANDWFWANEDSNGLQAVMDPNGLGNGIDNDLKYIQARLQTKGWSIDFDDEINNIVLSNRSGQTVALPISDAYDGHGWAQGTLAENFADGRGPGRPGDSQRHGIPKGATIAQLEKAAHSKGRKGQLARWQLNMRRGKKK